jgi:hypothetical protein
MSPIEHVAQHEDLPVIFQERISGDLATRESSRLVSLIERQLSLFVAKQAFG